MRKAALHNLGCKVNAYETEAMQQMLEQAGYEIVPFQQKADVYIINTCTVTNIADRKSRQMIHRARKQNPQAVVVAAGCYVQTSPESAAEDGTADILLANNHKSELIQKIEQFQKKKEKIFTVPDVAAETAYEPLQITVSRTHTRAFIKIQDGCENYCSYCRIPYARGRIRSRRMEEVLEEVNQLASSGILEVVLTGIHVSSYGKDTGEAFIDLIEEVNKIGGLKRIRLSSLEPGVITKEFVERLHGCEKVCPHFHLSLQSGCDETLKRMNRHYTTAQYREKCELLRQVYEHPAITTDVIVGFPGETDEEFEMTKRFLEEIHFYEMHIFKYSKREGTRAAGFPMQVSDTEKTERSGELIRLGQEMSVQFRKYYIGRTFDVLLEEEVTVMGKRYYQGYSREYVKILTDREGAAPNEMICDTAKELAAGEYLLFGNND